MNRKCPLTAFCCLVFSPFALFSFPFPDPAFAASHCRSYKGSLRGAAIERINKQGTPSKKRALARLPTFSREIASLGLRIQTGAPPPPRTKLL